MGSKFHFNSGSSYLGLVFVIWLLSGCAPARFVKPLNKGQATVGGSLGGPLIKYGNMVIPMPLTSIAAGYGIDSGFTGFAGLHTTSLLFGVFQTDIGVVKQINKQHGWVPAVTVSPVANIMIDKWAGKFSFFPQADINACWSYPNCPHYAYLCLSNWFDLNSKRSEGDAQKKHWLPVLQLGNTFVNRKWSYTIELKYAPEINTPVVVAYQRIGHSSATGVYIGVTKNIFNKGSKKSFN